MDEFNASPPPSPKGPASKRSRITLGRMSLDIDGSSSTGSGSASTRSSLIDVAKVCIHTDCQNPQKKGSRFCLPMQNRIDNIKYQAQIEGAEDLETVTASSADDQKGDPSN